MKAPMLDAQVCFFISYKYSIFGVIDKFYQVESEKHWEALRRFQLKKWVYCVNNNTNIEFDNFNCQFYIYIHFNMFE